MRLAFCLFKYFPYGGLQRDFLRIAKECLERGHQIDVYTMSWSGERPNGFNIYELAPKGLRNHQQCLNFCEQVTQKLAKHNYNCVIGFNKMPGLDVYFAADSCFQAKALQSRSKFYRLTSRYRTYVKLEKSVFDKKQRSKILLLNEQEKINFINLYGTQEERFVNVPAGIAADRIANAESEFTVAELRSEFGIDKNDIILVTVATYFKTKGLDRSLRAIGALPESLRKKIIFFVMGDDKSGPYLRLAKKLGIEKNLIFLGVREDVGRFLMAADLLLHPAVVENAGMVLLEALACGAPILTTANCGYAYHVAKAKSGVVLDNPFSQAILNQSLFEVLSILPKVKAGWKRAALEYITGIDIFSLPQEAATIIEQSHVSVA